jgi:excisionase family DNA binding protein
MAEPPTRGFQDRWLTTEEAGEYLGFAKRTLQRWRTEGTGPPYRKVNGNQARYHVRELDVWMDTNPSVGGSTE